MTSLCRSRLVNWDERYHETIESAYPIKGERENHLLNISVSSVVDHIFLCRFYCVMYIVWLDGRSIYFPFKCVCAAPPSSSFITARLSFILPLADERGKSWSLRFVWLGARGSSVREEARARRMRTSNKCVCAHRFGILLQVFLSFDGALISNTHRLDGMTRGHRFSTDKRDQCVCVYIYCLGNTDIFDWASAKDAIDR